MRRMRKGLDGSILLMLENRVNEGNVLGVQWQK
jgi:hypothetical protein